MILISNVWDRLYANVDVKKAGRTSDDNPVMVAAIAFRAGSGTASPRAAAGASPSPGCVWEARHTGESLWMVERGVPDGTLSLMEQAGW